MNVDALKESFNANILNILDIHSYYVYMIIRNMDVECTCVTHSTSQADVNCPKCLGTGYKITIRKVKASAQDAKLPTMFRNNHFMLARNFFIKGDFAYKDDDIIIDNDVAYLILEIQEGIGQQGSIPYRKVATIKKKFDTNKFIKNFKAIINKSR